MNTQKFFVGKTVSFIAVVTIIGGFFLLNNFIYQEKQGDGMAVEPYRASLEGEYVCLPYKDTVESTPAETECEPGIKTDTGEYYAVNFFLMSQMHAPLEIGQRFSAQGVITTDTTFNTPKWEKYNLMGVFSVTDSLTLESDNAEPYLCQADAKLCSDGSYVGRQGPSCEFTACPSAKDVATQVHVSLGKTATVKNVTISPQEIISDSRCPDDVVCVWAGTVEVRTTLATEVSHGEHVLKLGEPQRFGSYMITLHEVLPIKSQATIPDSSYRFTFLVTTEN